jgi:hypothetical protein
MQRRKFLYKIMNENGQNLAYFILQRLCKNAGIDGIRFGPILQILLSPEHSKELPIKGQVYINLSSNWKLFDSYSTTFLEPIEDLPNMTAEEEIQVICSIRGRTIKNVELGNNSPHLILTLDNERTICVNGNNDKYESWDIGVAFGKFEDSWQVIACPGGEVSIITPLNFDHSAFTG